MRRIARWAVTVLVAAAVAATGAVVVSAQPASAAWRAWSNLGQPAGGSYDGVRPALATRGNVVDMLVKGKNSEIRHRWWSAGDGWSGWANIGAPPDVAGVRSSDGISAAGRPGNRLSVVTIQYVNRSVWHKAWNNPGWGAWEPLSAPPGGLCSAPTVSSRPNGTVDVWAYSCTDFAVWHRYWTGGNTWHPWERINLIGGRAQPAAVGAPDGSVWLFAEDGVEARYKVWYPSLGWTGNFSVPMRAANAWLIDGIAVAARPSGVIDLYASAWDGSPVHHSTIGLNLAWSGWVSLGGSNVVSAPAAAARADGSLDVIVQTRGGNIYHNLHT